MEAVTIGQDGVTLDDIIVHDETDRTLASLLIDLELPDFPMVLGVIYAIPESTFEADIHKQIESVKTKSGKADLNAFIRQGRTWEVT